MFWIENKLHSRINIMTETLIVYKVDKIDASGFEKHHLVPTGSLTDILLGNLGSFILLKV